MKMGSYGICPFKNLVPFTLHSYFEIYLGYTLYVVNPVFMLNSIPFHDYQLVLAHGDGCLGDSSVQLL